MTNKQTIDVSKCKFYRDEVSFVHGETIKDVCSIWIWQRDYSSLDPSCVMKCHCSDNPNCYYKQLKTKEKECEKYKQTLTEIKEIAEKRNYLDYNECLDDILQKINECEV